MDNPELIEKKRREFTEKLKDPDFTAKLIAAYIRNNIDSFYGNHLNDKQMKKVNPLIRNAVYTALLDISRGSGRALVYAEYYIKTIGKTANMWNNYRLTYSGAPSV